MRIENAFGIVLRSHRKFARVSQESLGLQSGYSRAHVSLLERGLRGPSMGAVVRFAVCLQVEPGEMVTEACKLAGPLPERTSGQDS